MMKFLILALVLILSWSQPALAVTKSEIIHFGGSGENAGNGTFTCQRKNGRIYTTLYLNASPLSNATSANGIKYLRAGVESTFLSTHAFISPDFPQPDYSQYENQLLYDETLPAIDDGYAKRLVLLNPYDNITKLPYVIVGNSYGRLPLLNPTGNLPSTTCPGIKATRCSSCFGIR